MSKLLLPAADWLIPRVSKLSRHTNWAMDLNIGWWTAPAVCNISVGAQLSSPAHLPGTRRPPDAGPTFISAPLRHSEMTAGGVARVADVGAFLGSRIVLPP